jgi:hypothetical protein
VLSGGRAGTVGMGSMIKTVCALALVFVLAALLFDEADATPVARRQAVSVPVVCFEDRTSQPSGEVLCADKHREIK